MNNTNENLEVSLEELRAILEAKGLDIKELAKEAKELKAEKSLEEKVQKMPKIKAPSKGPVFELALVNYPDFVIRRSTAKTEKLLVIMVSQNSYYIKTVKNGSEVKSTLDRDSYTDFTAGMDEITMPQDFWVDTIKPGRAFFDRFNSVVNEECVRKAIIGRYLNKRVFYCSDWDFTSVMQVSTHIYTHIPLLVKEFPDLSFDNCWRYCWRFIMGIQNKFGLENAKDFIKETDRSLADVFMTIKTNYDAGDLFSNYEFKYSSFRDYVLYDSVRLGYGDHMRRFFDYWSDTLRMQMDLYGKIKDKYPKHLTEMHDQLAYKQRLMEQKVESEKFEKRIADACQYEATICGYVFIAPRQPQDFYDEATAMSNCLAGYVKRYANGEDYIFFMRKLSEPDQSLITIELDLNGNLLQAYQACNRAITAEQKMVIDKWLTKTVSAIKAAA